MARWRRWALELVVVAVLFIAIDQWRSKDLLDSGDQAPVGRLVTLNSQTAEIVPPDKPVLVYFFAPWCSVCKFSIGNLKALQQDYPDLKIRLVALDYGSREEVLAFIDDRELAFPVLMGNREVASDWRISVYPSYYLVGRDGRVTSRNMGYSSELGMKVRLELM